MYELAVVCIYLYGKSNKHKYEKMLCSRSGCAVIIIHRTLGHKQMPEQFPQLLSLPLCCHLLQLPNITLGLISTTSDLQILFDIALMTSISSSIF